MFTLIKLIIWTILAAAAAYFALPYFGYEFNLKYFTESKERCQQRLSVCTVQYIEQKNDATQCMYDCVNPQIIIKKK